MSEEEISDRMILIINGYKECLDYNCNQTEERQREIKYDIETLETMIDLYNKEKEKNEILEDTLNNSIDIRKYWISKDKIKEIIYPTPKNPIDIEIQSSGIYKKLRKLLEGDK